jgi:hypothetical protein
MGFILVEILLFGSILAKIRPRSKRWIPLPRSEFLTPGEKKDNNDPFATSGGGHS